MNKSLHFLALSFCLSINVSAQWQNQNAGFTNKTLGFYEFSIVNENVVWAICYDGIQGLFSSNPILDFTRTLDGGTTWVAGLVGNDTSLAFSNISAISATEAWVCMHKLDFSGGGGIYHTIDGGLTWNQSNAGVLFNSSSFPNFVHFKDALNGIAAGDSNDGYYEIYTTNNGGNSWSRTPQANIPSFLNGGDFGWFDGFAAIGNTIWFGTSSGQIYKSIDFGTTWTISLISPTNEQVYEIAFNDDGLHGLSHLRSGSTTKLFATSNGGLNWSQIPTSTIPNWKQSRICSVPGTNTFVSTSVNGGVNRGSSFSSDNGLTWTLIEATSPKAACRFLNNTKGWSGGFFNDNPLFQVSGGIFKWNSTLSLNENTNELSNLNVIIYPNPTNGIVTISLPENSNDTIKLDLYDVVGKKLNIDTTNQNTSNEINIDLSNLAKGNYFIKISDGSESVVKKISRF